MTTVRRLDTLDEIPQEAWDSLVGPLGFYSSHAWLRSQERSAAARPTYVVVERAGELLAASPVYEFTSPPAPLPVAGGASVLHAGPRTGYHNQLLVRQDGERHTRAHVTLLLHALAELAAERGRTALLLDHLTSSDLALLAVDLEAGAVLRGAEGVLHNEGGTFASYKRLLGKNARKKEHEWRRFAEAGFTVDTARLSETLTEVVPLIATTGARYDSALPTEEITRFLTEQARCADDSSVVFRCQDAAGALVGCSVDFRWQNTLYARVAGFDYSRLHNAFEYFNTVYYEPLRYMEAHGLTTLHLGVASLNAKARRAATLHPQRACAIPVPLRRGALRQHDPAADRALADAIAAEAGGGTNHDEWSADAFTKIGR